MDKRLYSALERKRKTLVFVTDQFECERIIKAGKVIADISHTELAVYNVNTDTQPQNPQALQYLFDVAKRSESEMNVIYSQDVFGSIFDVLEENWTVNAITGEPFDETSVLYKLWETFDFINFFTVDEQGHLHDVSRVASHDSER